MPDDCSTSKLEILISLQLRETRVYLYLIYNFKLVDVHMSSRAPDYITNGYGFPMQTTYHTTTQFSTNCTWPYVVPIGEDPAAHGHWCAFTDLYHTIPYHGWISLVVVSITGATHGCCKGSG